MDTETFLKLLAEPTRMRVTALLLQEELSVQELQEILEMGQSRISSQLARLKKGGIIQDRRDGKRSYYCLDRRLASPFKELLAKICNGVAAEPVFAEDKERLERIVEKRNAITEQYFNAIAERLNRHPCPGRSWEAIGQLLLRMTPEVVIADLGAGDGSLSRLLARRATEVICVDKSSRMVQVGQELGEKQGISNLRYVLGDIEALPLSDESVDISLLSQALHHAIHPEKALLEAWRILRPGGMILILDLLEHQFEKAREMYADRWLGFSEHFLFRSLKSIGFSQIEVTVVAREKVEPYFQTLLAAGVKEGSG